MAEQSIEIPDESPCLNCGGDVALSVDMCPECGEEVPYRFTTLELLTAFALGHIIDARMGGYIIGRTGPEDDIPMYRAIIPGVLQLTGMMHGGEFIVNSIASRENAERLWEINSSERQEDHFPLNSIPLTPTTRVFNTNGPKGADSNIAILVQSGQFVVSRNGTLEHFEELVEINDSAKPILFQAED